MRSARTFAPASLPFVAACWLTLGACCTGGASYLTLGMGRGSGTSAPRWGAEVTYRVSERPTLSVSYDPAHPVRGALFEVFAEGGAEPVALPCVEARIDNASRNGCGFSQDVTCDLGALAPGRYAVVHRRARGNGDALNCDDACPWTTFQGEPALRLTLVLLPRA